MRVYLLPLLVLFVAGYASLAFAETTFEIKIPSGASDPGAPFFWSEKSTGVTTGEITVFPGDSVIWHNADTAFHTITSVSADSIQTGEFEVDGKFDSGFFTAGKSFTQKFNDVGDFYYFCSIHPFMNGVVHVVKNPGNVKSIDNVGSGFSDDGLGFKVKYILDTNLQKAVHVNPDEKSLTFRISGSSGNDQITLVLPPKLIENPNAVFVDGVMTEFESESTSSGTKLILPITADSKDIKIMGTKVIPEFGFLAISILSIGVVSMLFLTRSKLLMFR
ncbi:copper-binding protein [Nitrosopumilus oxyclinae]|uniref:Copper-binding protein n=1 Tax=Nitrosopumilus oxyclinae TaxID=1959104 RepID=A0A7D5R0C9_9ARCH|nr:plastocyanin/azurin family copper-binding protein [Nitrosopumilus oxyclinae]QLH05556.1 copper-binding protein [Nitrosopumilus oxyclinae]